MQKDRQVWVIGCRPRGPRPLGDWGNALGPALRAVPAMHCTAHALHCCARGAPLKMTGLDHSVDDRLSTVCVPQLGGGQNFASQLSVSCGGGGGANTPPPRGPGFHSRKTWILPNEVLIWLFLVHKLLGFWVPGRPPTPLKENSGRGWRTRGAGPGGLRLV